MIKVTDLMINDWVSINGSFFRVKDIKKNGVIKLYYNTNYGEHEVDFNSDYLEEFLQPISLTKEILEKNGFEGDVYLLADVDDGKTLEYYPFENRISLYYTGEKNQERLELLFRCQCFHVHEFQHALKLYGIEKEIVL
jgi:hypothetical protein